MCVSSLYPVLSKTWKEPVSCSLKSRTNITRTKDECFLNTCLLLQRVLYLYVAANITCKGYPLFSMTFQTSDFFISSWHGLLERTDFYSKNTVPVVRVSQWFATAFKFLGTLVVAGIKSPEKPRPAVAEQSTAKNKFNFSSERQSNW